MSINPQQYEKINELHSGFDILPNECLIEIFQYLDIVDLIRSERVCKRWQLLCKKSWLNVTSLDISFTKKRSEFYKSTMKRWLHTNEPRVLHKILSCCGTYCETFKISIGKECDVISAMNIVNAFCKNIKTFIFSTKSPISDETLEKIFISHSKIESLKFGSITRSDGLYSKQLKIQNLKQLNLGCTMDVHLSQSAIHMILKQNLSIEELQINHTNDETIKIIKTLSALKKLHLGFYFKYPGPKINAEDILFSLKHNENLVDLKLNFGFADTSLENENDNDNYRIQRQQNYNQPFLPKLKKLEFVDLRYLPERFLVNISNTVTSIRLWQCSAFENHQIEYLVKKLRNLEYLQIIYCEFINKKIIPPIHTIVRIRNKIPLHMSVSFEVNLENLCRTRFFSVSHWPEEISQ